MRTCLLIGAVVASAATVITAQQPAPPECRDTADVRFVCNVQAAEDLVLVPGGQWIVASSYAGPGGIYLVRVSDRTSVLGYPSQTGKQRFDAKTYSGCPGPPDANRVRSG